MKIRAISQAVTIATLGTLGVLSAGQAAAQSSVTIYGIVDTCLARADLGAANVTRLSPGCQAGNRLGFRGVEDLGGGLKAYFQLENGFNVDDGTIGQGGRLFGRKALVALSSPKWGSVEFGRDYAPAFYLIQPVDPMGLGIGTLSSTMWTGANPTTVARNDNAINYISPAWGPVTVRAQYSLGEQAAGQPKHGRDTVGFNALYRSGPLLAGLAYASHRNAADTGKDSATTVGLRYAFGAMSVAAAFQKGGWEGTRTAAAPASATSIFSRDYSSWMVGGTVDAWAGGRILLSLKKYDDRTANNFDANQFTVTAIHALSKRTELYASTSKVRNSSGAYPINDASTSYSGVTPGANPSLFAVGVKHTF